QHTCPGLHPSGFRPRSTRHTARVMCRVHTMDACKNCKLHPAMASISTNLWHLTISRRVKKLVSLRGLLTFFFFLRFLPTECPQSRLKPGGASKARKGSFSCRYLVS